MTIQINVGNHKSPLLGSVAFPNNRRETMRWALNRAIRITSDIVSADIYFSKLPNGRTLTDLLADKTIWISYHPTGTVQFLRGPVKVVHFLGVTHPMHRNDVTVSIRALKLGKWMTLATLIHELAHLNGAPRTRGNKQAEEAVLACGMGKLSEQSSGIDDPQTPYHPGVSG